MSDQVSNDQVLEVAHHDGGVVVLTLSRPAARNALNAALRQALVDTVAELAADDTVAAVVLHGSGGTFCAGFDLKELAEASDPGAVFAHATTYHHAVYTFAKPLVAAVEGAAVAGGMDLALMCDLRVAAEDARFGQPQVRMGIPAAHDLLATVCPDRSPATCVSPDASSRRTRRNGWVSSTGSSSPAPAWPRRSNWRGTSPAPPAPVR